MATAEKSNDEEDGELKNLDEEIDQIRSAKKELFKKARPINDELERLRLCEIKVVDRRQRLTNEQHYREKHQQTVQRVIELESQLEKSQSANVRLKQSLDQATKQSKSQLKRIAKLEDTVAAAENKPRLAKEAAQTIPKAVDSWTVGELEKQLNHTTKLLNETKGKLSEVQDRLTLSEQVTAATRQRAIQQSDDSEKLQTDLAPQLQTTSHAG